jgi:hypothetical protein
VAAIAVACTDILAPLPNGATPWTPPAQFALWWRMTESCSGTQGDFRSIKWYIVPNVKSFDLDGQEVQGETIGTDRIVLVESMRLDGLLVRHEMLHALLRDTGHARQFLNACNDIVACEGACEKEAGGRPVPPPDAPVITPRELNTRVEIVPRQPFASQDSGAVALIVSITNPLSTPAWVRLTPQAPGDPVSHTFGMAMDYNDPNPEGYGFKGYYFIEGTRFPLGANETRRLVWDDILPAGTFGFRGWFNADTSARLVVTVGP